MERNGEKEKDRDNVKKESYMSMSAYLLQWALRAVLFDGKEKYILTEFHPQ